MDSAVGRFTPIDVFGRMLYISDAVIGTAFIAYKITVQLNADRHAVSKEIVDISAINIPYLVFRKGIVFRILYPVADLLR